MPKQRIILLICLLLLGACGRTDDSVGGPALPLATITPAATLTAAPPQPTSTPIFQRADTSTFIQAGQQAMTEQNYEQAVIIFTQLSMQNPQNQDLRLLISEAYARWGDVTISASNGENEKVRSGFDQYNHALRYLPADHQDGTKIRAARDSAQHFLDIKPALESLSALEDPSERQRVLEQLLSAADFINTHNNAMPGFKPMYRDILLAAAEFQIALAKNVEGRANKLEFWEQGRNYCQTAVELWESGAEQAKPAVECVSRFKPLIDPPPPTAVPRPTPIPLRPTATAVPQRGYYGRINRNYPEVQGKSSGNAASCITGRVIQRNGSGVGGAVGNINNGGPGIEWTTNGNGDFSLCGLGYSNWAVVLNYTPNGFNGNLVVAGVWVNGNSDQVGVVEFRER